jgi:DNA-binding MarR family transcriptional regulator
MATVSSSDVQADEIIDALRDLIRYRNRLMASLSEEIIQRVERLDKLRLGDGLKRTLDNDLFYRIGMYILSQHKGPITMGQLSKELVVPLSTATRIVDNLVAVGLVQRVADPEDRRVVRVTLSEEGRQLYRAVHEHLRQHIERLLSPLEAGERDQLIVLLRKVVNGLAESDK